MQVQLPAYVQILDAAIRIFSFPTLVGVLVWVVRTYDRGQAQLKEIDTNAKTINAKVDVIQTNHLAHLQTGIAKVAESNDKAVELLTQIDKSMTVLIDRFPRA
jgi:hypothetical protein